MGRIHKNLGVALGFCLSVLIFASHLVFAANANGRYATNPQQESYPSSSFLGGITAIRASDIMAMRTLINAKRRAAGLADYNFTDPVLMPGSSLIRARHFTEIAVALKEIYSAPSTTVPPNVWSQYYQQHLRSQLYSVTPPNDNASHVDRLVNQPIRASTMTALRDAISAAGNCGDNICQNYSGQGPENCDTCPADCRSGCSASINPVCGAPCGSAGLCNASSRCQTTTCPVEASCSVEYACLPSIACSCGNGTCDAATNEDIDNCPADCTPAPVCGNHKIEAGEECEVGLPMAAADCARLGPYTGVGACTACKIDLSGCVSTLSCGNGVVDPGEDCDGSFTQTCTGLGLPAGQPGLACSRDCKWDTSGCGLCRGGPVNGLFPIGIKSTWAPDWCDAGSCPSSGTVVSIGFEKRSGVVVDRYKTRCTPPGKIATEPPTSGMIGTTSFVPAAIANTPGGSCTLDHGCSPACTPDGAEFVATNGQSIFWDTMYCYYSYVDVCGNGACESGESNASCPADCTAAAPSCSDGIQNQAETGIDCGGPCTACASNPCAGAIPVCSSCPATGAYASDSPGCCVSRCLSACDTTLLPWTINGGCGGQCAAPLTSTFTQCGVNEACSNRSMSGYSGPACYFTLGSSDYACQPQPTYCNCGDGTCAAREDFFHCPSDCAYCNNAPANAVLCSESYKDGHTSQPTVLIGNCGPGNSCGSPTACSYCCPSGTHYVFSGTWASARCIPDSCGNGVLNSGEQCDGSALNGQTCQTQGFSGGSLTCTANCDFNTSSCS